MRKGHPDQPRIKGEFERMVPERLLSSICELKIPGLTAQAIPILLCLAPARLLAKERDEALSKAKLTLGSRLKEVEESGGWARGASSAEEMLDVMMPLQTVEVSTLAGPSPGYVLCHRVHNLLSDKWETVSASGESESRMEPTVIEAGRLAQEIMEVTREVLNGKKAPGWEELMQRSCDIEGKSEVMKQIPCLSRRAPSPDRP